MSNNHRRMRKSRSVRTSHFVEDVTMCVLNDPLPPYHPATPPPDLQQSKFGVALEDDGDGKYYDFDLSKLARQSLRVQNAVPHIAADNSAGPPIFVLTAKDGQNGNPYNFHQAEFSPVLSNETKRLLQEVENIQRTYQHRTLNQLAFEIGLKDRFEDGEDTENIVDKKSAIYSSIQKRKHQKSSKGSNMKENNQEGTNGSSKVLQLHSDIHEQFTPTKDNKHILVSPKGSAFLKEANPGKFECSSSASQKIVSDGTSAALPSNRESNSTSCTSSVSYRRAAHKSKRVRKIRQVTSDCLLSITSGREERRTSCKVTATESAPERKDTVENESIEQENPAKNNLKRHSPEATEVKEKYQKIRIEEYSPKFASKESTRITISSKTTKSTLIKGHFNHSHGICGESATNNNDSKTQEVLEETKEISNISPSKAPILESTATEGELKALKEKQREERKSQKPWRENMKSADSLDKQTENANEGKSSANKNNPCDEDLRIRQSGPFMEKATNLDDIGVTKKDVEQTAAKPWRQNMKRSSGSQEAGKEHDCKQARQRYDRAKVRQYMKQKREKEIANKMQKEQDQEKKKQLLKDRLMTLELKATHAASKSQSKSEGIYKHDINTNEMNFSRKREQEEHLKRLLTQLTTEMRQKYSLGQIDGKMIEDTTTNGKFTKHELLRASNSCEKLRKLSESQEPVSMSISDQSVTENKVIISESAIIDSCGIVSQQSSQENSKYHEDYVKSNEFSRDQEDIELPICIESHGTPISKKNNEKTENNEGIKYESSCVLLDEAYLEQHEQKDNKTELAGFNVFFNDQTITTRNQDIMKHLTSAQENGAQQREAYPTYVAQYQEKRESASFNALQNHEYVSKNIRTDDRTEANASVVKLEEISNSSLSKKSIGTKTIKFLEHDHQNTTLNNSSSDLLQRINSSKATQKSNCTEKHNSQRLSNCKIVEKSLPSKRYSFENELPVRDPGPYSPAFTSGNKIEQSDNTARITNPSSDSGNKQLRSQVQELLIRHQEDLKFVQQSNIGIKLPKPLVAMASLNNKNCSKTSSNNSQILHVAAQGILESNASCFQPDVVPVKEKEMHNSRDLLNSKDVGLTTISDVEEAPPRIHFAETPDDLTLQNSNNVDPFNFMSTVQRKFLMQTNSKEAQLPAAKRIPPCTSNKIIDHKQYFGESDIILSEGPLSTSFASSHQADHQRNNFDIALANRPLNYPHEKDDLDNNVNENLNIANDCIPKKARKVRKEKAAKQIDHSQSKFQNTTNPKDLPTQFHRDGAERIGSVQSKNDSLNNIETTALPSSLQLRFQAELNHMESMQEAERQINQITQLKDLVSAAKNHEDIQQEKNSKSSIKDSAKRRSEKRKESRSDFENRVKRELQELINNRMQNLVTSQTEATKVTADAAKQLAELHKSIQTENYKNLNLRSATNTGITASELKDLVTKSQVARCRATNTRSMEEIQNEKNSLEAQSFIKRDKNGLIRGDDDEQSKRSEIPEELLTLISKAESNIPEVLSMIEKTDKSGSSIQKTISEVIRQLSVDDKSSKSNNITEDISKEIESDYTSHFLEEEESNTIHQVSFLGEPNLQEKSPLNNETTTDRNSDSGKKLAKTKSNRSKSNASSVLNQDSSSSNVSSISNRLATSTMPTSKRKSKSSVEKYTNDLFQQHIFAENLRSQQQYALLKGKEKLLAEKTASELSKIQIKKTEITSRVQNSANSTDQNLRQMANEKLQKLKDKERQITKRHKERTKEINDLKQAIKLAEKDRKRMLEHQQLLTTHYLQEEGYGNLNNDALLVQYHNEGADTSSTTTSRSIPNEIQENIQTEKCRINKQNNSHSTAQKSANERRESKQKIRKNLDFSSAKSDGKAFDDKQLFDSDEALDETQDSTTQENNASDPKDKIIDMKGRESACSPTSRKESLRKKVGNHVTPLKAPLSPKSSRKFGSSLSNISLGGGSLSSTRKRHSSAGSSTDDSLSISQAETISSDHSDMEIKINTLQDELKRRVITANKLKRQQKVKRREKLKLQEEALKKQIEAYDSLIVKTKAELEESINSTSSLVIVQPQIKTPKESLGKTYEREDHDQYSPRNIPQTAPAAFSASPPSWPSTGIKKRSSEDNIDSSICSSVVPKEISDASPVPPLGISSRDSSIETVLTTSPSKTPDVAAGPPPALWDKKTALIEDSRQNVPIKAGNANSEEYIETAVTTNGECEKTDHGKNRNNLDIHLPKTTVDDATLSIDKEIESSTANQQTDLNYSDDFTCNISTASETPSSDANIITVSPTKTMTIEQGNIPEVSDKYEIESSSILVDDVLNIEQLAPELSSLLSSSNNKSRSNSNKKVIDDEQIVSKVNTRVSTKAIDSICDKLMNELVKDTYSCLKESIKEKAEKNLDEKANIQTVNSSNEEIGVEVSEKSEDIQSAYKLPSINNENNQKIENVERKEKHGFEITQMGNTSTDMAARTSRRPQDLILTFDLSSESSSEESPNSVTSKRKNNLSNAEQNIHSEIAAEDSEVNIGDFEAAENFIDDDFGLSLQQEHIRKRQLLIEQEITRIQQETGVVSLREIPDKPPPPYTPPASPSSKVLRLRLKEPEITRYVPSSKTEIDEFCGEMSKLIFDMHETYKASQNHHHENSFITKLLDMALPEAIIEVKEKVLSSTGSGDHLNNDFQFFSSHTMFVNFMFDLVKEISAAIYSCETEKQNHIWMVQKPLMKARLALPKDSASLSSIVCREIMVAFGYEKRAAKENLIVRWSPQKRRDRVDQILVRELHSEEKEWTDYSQDETIVKDSVAESLFELLITDTVDHVMQALVK